MAWDHSGGDGVSRRRVLQTLGGAGTVALTGCLGTGGTTGGTATETDAVTIGISTPASGRYADIGAHERRGFELAVEHLNAGGGLVDTDEFGDLSGDGVLGRTVETTVVDSESDPTTAETQVRQRLEAGSLSMFTGGIAGGVARVHRNLADEYGVPYFVGTSTLDELTGGNCSAHVYRELFNSTTLVRALVPELAAETDGSQSFYQIYTDTVEGLDLKDRINTVARASDYDVRALGNSSVRPGTTDFEDALNQAATTNVDLVFLDLLGLDAVNAVRQAQDVLSAETTLVVPFLTRSVADALGERVAGIYGTVGWHESLDTPLSSTFTDAYDDAYGDDGQTALVPPGPAQNTYGQVLLWASAAESAGSFDAATLRETLEGYTYALGAGKEEMRGCDHQALRAVPVVRGTEQPGSANNHFELLRGRRNLEPACDEDPAAACKR